MSPRRIFLSWRQPLLGQAAHWLLGQAPRRQGWFELGDFLVVVPGQRAARLLLRALCQQAKGFGLAPPRLLTPGALTEALYPPQQPIAGALTELVAWYEALLDTPQEELVSWLPMPPERDDLNSWLELASELIRLDRDLVRGGFAPAAVLDRLPSHLATTQHQRWSALERTRDGAHERLAASGLVSRAQHQLNALSRRPEAPAARLVLVGLSELDPIFRQLLAPLSDRLDCLIHAPESLAASIDAWGNPHLDHWLGRSVDLDGVSIEVVERPQEQVLAAAQRTQELIDGGRSPSGLTVGVAEPAALRAHCDEMRCRGIAVHSPVGQPVAQSRPWRLIDALSRTLTRGRLADLAELLRHTDLESWLEIQMSQPQEVPGGASPSEAEPPPEDWLTLLDRYSVETVAQRVEGALGGRPRTVAAIETLKGVLSGLARGESAKARRAASEWSEVLTVVLEKIYDRSLDASLPLHRATIQALETLGMRLSELRDAVRLRVTLRQAVQLLLASVSTEYLESFVEDSGGEAVEVVGWLELAHDDAEGKVINGLNEGVLPQRLAVDPWLTPPLRRALGLVDPERRYVRDLFVLTGVVQSTEHVTVIAGRRSDEGEPLLPSRLLLAAPSDELARRLESFYQATVPPRESRVLAQAATSHWRPPIPRRLPEAWDGALPVTAFRTYLACPYRFYLRHVLGLRGQRDRPRELEPSHYGRFVHELLHRFALTEASSSADEAIVEGALQSLLSEAKERWFGGVAAPTVPIQLAQLERRLTRFAAWHAADQRQGWRLHRFEEDLRADLDVDGEPVRLHGRVDRLDRHPGRGLRLVDYKTAEVAQSPEQTHRHRSRSGDAALGSWRGWVDLQLPLYAYLVRAAGYDDELTLGYYCVSRDVRSDGLILAEWDEHELDEAVEVARNVVRAMRRGVFWPPGPPALFDDGLSWSAWDRNAVARRVETADEGSVS